MIATLEAATGVIYIAFTVSRNGRRRGQINVVPQLPQTCETNCYFFQFLIVSSFLYSFKDGKHRRSTGGNIKTYFERLLQGREPRVITTRLRTKRLVADQKLCAQYPFTPAWPRGSEEALILFIF
jgi:hypothetical protein